MTTFQSYEPSRPVDHDHSQIPFPPKNTKTKTINALIKEFPEVKTKGFMRGLRKIFLTHAPEDLPPDKGDEKLFIKEMKDMLEECRARPTAYAIHEQENEIVVFDYNDRGTADTKRLDKYLNLFWFLDNESWGLSAVIFNSTGTRTPFNMANHYHDRHSAQP